MDYRFLIGYSSSVKTKGNYVRIKLRLETNRTSVICPESNFIWGYLTIFHRLKAFFWSSNAYKYSSIQGFSIVHEWVSSLFDSYFNMSKNVSHNSHTNCWIMLIWSVKIFSFFREQKSSTFPVFLSYFQTFQNSIFFPKVCSSSSSKCHPLKGSTMI